jgi:hypothetical protein
MTLVPKMISPDDVIAILVGASVLCSAYIVTKLAHISKRFSLVPKQSVNVVTSRGVGSAFL